MHEQVMQFVRKVREGFPQHFSGASVVEFGSSDINGSVRDLFRGCSYVGIDLHQTRGVDWVGFAHDYIPSAPVDTVVSTEMLEHDEHWARTLQHAHDILRPGGLMVFTCAAPGRGEHGTSRSSPADSPMTNHYYRELSDADVEGVLKELALQDYMVEVQASPNDLRFWAIKAL